MQVVQRLIPNYYQVMSGKTGHAEAIEIIYDSSKVSFDMLLKVFFDSHNPYNSK